MMNDEIPKKRIKIDHPTSSKKPFAKVEQAKPLKALKEPTVSAVAVKIHAPKKSIKSKIKEPKVDAPDAHLDYPKSLNALGHDVDGVISGPNKHSASLVFNQPQIDTDQLHARLMKIEALMLEKNKPSDGMYF
jgi:hypothetical protein